MESDKQKKLGLTFRELMWLCSVCDMFKAEEIKQDLLYCFLNNKSLILLDDG